MAKKKKKGPITADHPIHPDWPYYGAPRDITKVLEKTYSYGMGGYRTFEKWVELCHLALDDLPDFLHQAVEGMRLQQPISLAQLQASPEQQERWKAAIAGQRSEVVELFAKAFSILLDATIDVDGRLSYADVVGSTFQLFGVSKSHQRYAGIFFTPFNIAYMMAKMTLGNIEEELKQRWVQALSHESTKLLGTALSLSILAAEALEAEEYGLEMLAKLLPIVKSSPAWEPIRILDPCVGSGALLLAAAKAVPRYAVDFGLVEFYGVDINPLCVDMCRLNFRLYGIIPLKLAPADLLSIRELQSLPDPYPELYEKALTDADPGREHWIQQVRNAGATQTSFL